MSPTISWTAEFVGPQIERAVYLLSAESGVQRVWFFGSASRRQAGRGSDLDFAVEGLDRLRHFSVLGELMLQLRCPVDLVRWEEASNALRAAIVRSGTIVYAA